MYLDAVHIIYSDFKKKKRKEKGKKTKQNDLVPVEKKCFLSAVAHLNTLNISSDIELTSVF